MSLYTTFNLKQDCKRKTHDVRFPTTEEIDEGRRNMNGKLKPPEMARVGYIEDALYPKVESYAVAEDLKYEDVIDIKVLDKYRNTDTIANPLAQVYRREFDQKNRHNVYAINWDNGVKTISLNHPRGLQNCNHIIVNDVDSLTENGTWNVGGNVVNLRLDELNHITRKASISFDINDSSTTGFITCIGMKPVNIADYLNKGAAFAWLFLPIPKEMISVRLTLGSDPNDLTNDLYYATVNQPHDNNTFTTLWNLLKYMLNNLNTIGTPNPKDLTYMRFDFTTTGQPIPGCRINSVMARKGEVYEMSYNSNWCFIDATTGAWKKLTTDGSDYMPFEDDTYQIFMLEVALVLQKNIYGNNAAPAADVTAISDELHGQFYRGRLMKEGLYTIYKRQHKAEFVEPEQYTNQMGRQYYGGQYLGRHDHHSRPEGWSERGGGNGDNNC